MRVVRRGDPEVVSLSSLVSYAAGIATAALAVGMTWGSVSGAIEANALANRQNTAAITRVTNAMEKSNDKFDVHLIQFEKLLTKLGVE